MHIERLIVVCSKLGIIADFVASDSLAGGLTSCRSFNAYVYWQGGWALTPICHTHVSMVANISVCLQLSVWAVRDNCWSLFLIGSWQDHVTTLSNCSDHLIGKPLSPPGVKTQVNCLWEGLEKSHTLVIRSLKQTVLT